MALEILTKNLFILWLEWQFFDVPKGILNGWKNFLKFNLNYFSVPLLLRTFFSHWRRYRYSYGRGFSPARYFEVFVFNVMSRVIGAVLRTFLIVTGILTEILIFSVGLFVFLGWLVLPVILITGFFYGFKLLF
jgi:hypothetical protein